MNQLLRAILIYLPLSLLCFQTSYAEEGMVLEENQLLSEIPELPPIIPADTFMLSYLPPLYPMQTLQTQLDDLLIRNMHLQSNIEQNKDALFSGRMLLQEPQAFGFWFYGLLATVLFLGMIVGYRLGLAREENEPEIVEVLSEEAPVAEADQNPVPIMKSKAALDTLLDLSKTYSSMEDFQTAKQFLEEVLEFGDETQKVAAKERMEALASS